MAKYLVYKNTDNQNISLSGFKYIDFDNLGNHHLCMRTGAGNNEIIRYGLTTDTTATGLTIRSEGMKSLTQSNLKTQYNVYVGTNTFSSFMQFPAIVGDYQTSQHNSFSGIFSFNKTSLTFSEVRDFLYDQFLQAYYGNKVVSKSLNYSTNKLEYGAFYTNESYNRPDFSTNVTYQYSSYTSTLFINAENFLTNVKQSLYFSIYSNASSKCWTYEIKPSNSYFVNGTNSNRYSTIETKKTTWNKIKIATKMSEQRYHYTGSLTYGKKEIPYFTYSQTYAINSSTKGSTSVSLMSFSTSNTRLNIDSGLASNLSFFNNKTSLISSTNSFIREYLTLYDTNILFNSFTSSLKKSNFFSLISADNSTITYNLSYRNLSLRFSKINSSSNSTTWKLTSINWYKELDSSEKTGNIVSSTSLYFTHNANI